MKHCEGCGYVFASTVEEFGATGQAFCCSCWFEEQELEIARWPLELEAQRLRRDIDQFERDLERALRYKLVPEVFTVEMCLDTVREAIADVDEELACLTVAYQRRSSVIGRAA